MRTLSGNRFGIRILVIIASLILTLTACTALNQSASDEFTSTFPLENCDFQTQGQNPYFSLNPGHQSIFAAGAGGASRLMITVLKDTTVITLPDIGPIETRVIEEREWEDGDLVEVSRNFFALCQPANAVYYFGETVDIFHHDGSVTHEGAWQAGQPDEDGTAEPGLIMPGTFQLGAKYYQEIADGIALDRAEHVDTGLAFTSAAGTFEQCVRVLETTPLEPLSKSEKIYCPEVGLVDDDGIKLVEINSNASDGQN
jgi:hypothetical protein